MNAYRNRLLNAPNIERVYCPFCGRVASNRHHIAPKGMGGRKVEGPTVCVCGNGNTSGCHRKIHDGIIHLDRPYKQWIYTITDEPMSIDRVMSDDSLVWRPVPEDPDW